MLPPRHCEPRNSAAAEDRAATWEGLGIVEIGAMVGGLIHRDIHCPSFSPPCVSTSTPRVKGYSSSVLLLDRTGARVRTAAGAGLPASYMKQLEGTRVSWIETPFGATINAKAPLIVLDPISGALGEGREASRAAPPGLRLHEVSPVLALTGEPLGIFAVYQRESNLDVTRCHSAIRALHPRRERRHSANAQRRSTQTKCRTSRKNATPQFDRQLFLARRDRRNYVVQDGLQLFEFDHGRRAGDTRAVRPQIHSRRPPVFPRDDRTGARVG